MCGPLLSDAVACCVVVCYARARMQMLSPSERCFDAWHRNQLTDVSVLFINHSPVFIPLKYQFSSQFSACECV